MGTSFEEAGSIMKGIPASQKAYMDDVIVRLVNF